ncbi:MAG: Hsp20/alpha crystallin family protein [Capsulimonadales bacterium]|nr:Hsp20/alpha crystallin family protein [Capsulimonadales bacterium]
MGIVRFDPFREMERLQNEMNRIFDGINSVPEGRSGNIAQNMRLWSPSVDVAENESEIVIHAELPGMKQEDIDIELTGDTLTLRGERKFENEERKQNFVRVERSYGRFQRSFTVATPIRSDQVTATYRDGVLEIRLPKSEEQRPRKVQVVRSAPQHIEPKVETTDGNA